MNESSSHRQLWVAANHWCSRTIEKQNWNASDLFSLVLGKEIVLVSKMIHVCSTVDAFCSAQMCSSE